MKRSLLLLGNVVLGAGFALAQHTPVTQQPQNRTVVLEELTGINCQYCPDGHLRANNLAAANPGRVVLVNVHAGGYATPGPGQPNLQTTDGTALDNFFNPDGYPAGALQRTPYGTETMLATGRGNWADMAATALAQPSPVNIALDADIDATTRVVTVTVEMFYTSPLASGTNHHLNIGIVQNNYEGPQVSGAIWNPTAVLPNGNYLHQHMFRGFINANGTWGEPIDASQTGVITRTVTYTLPASINGIELNLSQLQFFAFLQEGHNGLTDSKIVTGAEVTPTIANIPVGTAAMKAITNDLNVCPWRGVAPVVQVKNTGNEVTSLTFSTVINGEAPQTYDWTGSIPFEGTADISIPNVLFTPSASNSAVVTITSVNAGVGVISVASKTKPITMATGILENDVVVKITTDQYGSETTWKIFNSAGVEVGAGGPYTDAAASGAYPQADVTLTLPSDCYSLQVFDAYGDGFDSGYGNGNIEVRGATSSTIAGSVPTFASGKTKADAFQTGSISGLDELTSLESLTIYPNPAQNETTLEIVTTSDSKISYKVINTLGQVVMGDDLGTVNGQKTVSINTSKLNAGMYFVNFSINGISTQKPLSIIK